MTPDRWKRIEEIYHSARGRPSADRAGYLAEACRDDDELRLEIESLLANGEILSKLESRVTSTSAPTALITSTMVGPYRIEERLDAGGMGVVYRALDTRLDRQVAIKIGLAQFSDRFHREARTVAALNHVNVCTLHDIGSTPEIPGYLVMEFIEGSTLAKKLEKGAMPIPEALQIACQMAAALAAAHDVLVSRFLSKKNDLDTLLTNYLKDRGLLGDPGVGVGQIAAAAIINLRSGDGSFPLNPSAFVGGMKPGEWRPTLPAFASMAAPWLGTVVPFTLKDSSQLRASPPPPQLNTGQYAKDYDEVKALGGASSTVRTPEQTALALFYSDNFLTLWERTLRGISNANLQNIGDSARLFALANIAASDAIISAWDNKKFWNYWRPITAIQEGDNDGNPKTIGDPNWLPLLPTPAYPEYTSGANNLTGAMTRSLEHYFGDQTTFQVFSTPVNTTKTYSRFSDMADDVVIVRIYQGIHFRSADEVARRQGTHAADWAVSHFLRPAK